MVMNELIEPGLKPAPPPQRGYFCALLFSLPSTIFCVYIRRAGTESSTRLTSHSHDVKKAKGSFKIVAIV